MEDVFRVNDFENARGEHCVGAVVWRNLKVARSKDGGL